jgi:F-type H+-transporting ATPase subunit gamma
MYLAGFIYGAMIDSFCSEQNARMTAMNSANDNAEEIMSELSVEYNRVRQAAITQEITEVAAGAKALRRKKKKKTGEAVS